MQLYTNYHIAISDKKKKKLNKAYLMALCHARGKTAVQRGCSIA